ncbi:hypothetical protein BN938_1428 [Mucinivorans hirudinis]|uniref:Dipeptidyl peptidase IV n=1 Tax=Mucinivorans hirudinis TaxID=1433126 RepID=A0A060R819_9BACT|nr:hypothetical protein BN938_1428 [Mucinivorans hirudinis]
MKKLILTFALLIAVVAVAAQQKMTPVTKANYELPNRFSPDRTATMLFSTMVDPHFLKNSQQFWYSYQTPAGRNWYLVNPAKGAKKLLFDPAKMAAAITEIVKDPYDAQHLPITNISFNDAETGFYFEIMSTVDMTKEEFENWKKEQTILEIKPENEHKSKKKSYWMFYDLATGKVSEVPDYKRPKGNPSWASVSPDSTKVLFARNYNLYWMTAEDMEKAKRNEKDSTIVEHQITTDGEKDFAWGGARYSNINAEELKREGTRQSAWAIWSPDSKNFVLSRTDNRKVGDLWVIDHTASPRPTLESYKYHMPGEANAPQQYVYIFDVETMTPRMVDAAAFKDQTMEISPKPTPKKFRDDIVRPSTTWPGDHTKFYMTRKSRDLKRIDICVVDVATGKVTTLIEERMNTSMESRAIWPANGGTDLIVWSQRSGWANLYLYSDEGTLRNKITDGDFHCETVLAADDATQTVYFLANGVEKGENPYYTHIYSVKYDGTGMKRLSEQDFEHQISLNDENKYFIDNYSRVNTTPRSVLRDNTGKKIMDLEEADLSLLFAAGYKFPEIFTFKAADGVTDMWGTMYKPIDFDSTKIYPIIEYVYPGPQTEANNTAFAPPTARTDRLAQFGFIVITLGNRGGHPSRSKWYHNYGYGNLRDYGLADKKTAVEQLANKYPWIDREKVGIHGHSGGGFMSTAAILVYPNFFKVAVSCAGNHQNNIYNRWWSEKHHGVLEKVDDKGDTTFIYNIAKNADVAANLKGKLMLIHGDIDENVHAANTLTVVKALIKNNKRFDMLILPGQRHGFGDMNEYFFWTMGDYFTEHLLGDSEKGQVDIRQMNR